MTEARTILTRAGWSEDFAGDWDILPVEGTHVSIMLETGISELGRTISDALAKAGSALSLISAA